jgi:hypothetical protein
MQGPLGSVTNCGLPSNDGRRANGPGEHAMSYSGARCSRCEYFHDTKGSPADNGECRRRTPQITNDSPVSTTWGRRGRWPVVLIDEWCGEYSLGDGTAPERRRPSG